MEIDKQRIEDAIVKQVAADLISDESLWDKAKRAFDDRIEKLWKTVAEDRIRAEIERAVTNGFEREYQKVDSFGGPRGEKTSIRAELEKHISGYWNQLVDSKGVHSTSSYNTVTRAEWMMSKLVADDFQGVMKQHVVNIGGSLKDNLRKELHTTVNKLLSDVFYVKTADDVAAAKPGKASIHPPTGPVPF